MSDIQVAGQVLQVLSRPERFEIGLPDGSTHTIEPSSSNHLFRWRRLHREKIDDDQFTFPYTVVNFMSTSRGDRISGCRKFQISHLWDLIDWIFEHEWNDPHVLSDLKEHFNDISDRWGRLAPYQVHTLDHEHGEVRITTFQKGDHWGRLELEYEGKETIETRAWIRASTRGK